MGVVRLFVIAFTRKMGEQVKTNCYAQSAQIRKIRAKMMEIMTKEAGTVQLRELVKKLIPESIGKEIEKRTQGIFPLKDVFVRKVKIIKKPKFDITKLMEMHGDGDGDAGVEMLSRRPRRLRTCSRPPSRPPRATTHEPSEGRAARL